MRRAVQFGVPPRSKSAPSVAAKPPLMNQPPRIGPEATSRISSSQKSQLLKIDHLSGPPIKLLPPDATGGPANAPPIPPQPAAAGADTGAGAGATVNPACGIGPAAAAAAAATGGGAYCSGCGAAAAAAAGGDAYCNG